MDQESLVFAWMALCGIAICNLIAGGSAALFHIWSGSSTPGVRMLAGAAMGGFVPAISIGGLVIISAGTGLFMDAWVVMSVVFLLGLVSSLPLAAITTRYLRQVPEVRSHFE